MMTMQAETVVGDETIQATGSMVRDITEYQQVLLALRESQRSQQTLMSNLPGMAYRSCNDPDWTKEFVSEGCYHLTGYRPQELIGNHKISYAQLIHPDDRHPVWLGVQAALQEYRPFQLTYRINTASGEEKWVWEQGRGVYSESGELLAIEGWIADITSRKRAEEELHLLQTMIQAITDAEDFTSALQVALQKVCEATGWNYGEAWIPRADGTVLECSQACYISTPGLQPFRKFSELCTFTPGMGLPGRVWLSQQPEWFPNVSTTPESVFPRAKIAQECGLKAGFGVPILSHDRVLAVLGFFMFESRQKDERLVDLVCCIAAQLGSVMQRKLAEVALQESQRRLCSLIDSLPGIVFSCTNDPHRSMTYLSQGVLTLTGYSSSELVGNQGLCYNAIIHAEDLPKVLEAIQTATATKQTYVVEYRICTKEGEEKWVWEKGNGVTDELGKVLEIEGFITDISDRKRSEDALRQAEAKYRSIFENTIEGIFQTTSDGQYISANPALARLYGYSSPAELMEHLTDIEHQLYVEPNRRAEFIRLLQENHAVVEFESQVYRADGQVIWISENARAVRDDNGALLYYEGTVEDITEHLQAKEQLRQCAFYDTLTNLPNRALFMERLRNAVEQTKQCQNYKLAVLFLDLDGFKLVNDSFGHLLADKLLMAIARRLEGCVRSHDTVARLGGDEFTILLENIQDINNATNIAERIHEKLQAPFNIDGHEVYTTASIGIVLSWSQEIEADANVALCPSAVALNPEPSTLTLYDQAEDLLRDADTALYRAKTLGKGRHEVFDAIAH